MAGKCEVVSIGVGAAGDDWAAETAAAAAATTAAVGGGVGVAFLTSCDSWEDRE